MVGSIAGRERIADLASIVEGLAAITRERVASRCDATETDGLHGHVVQHGVLALRPRANAAGNTKNFTKQEGFAKSRAICNQRAQCMRLWSTKLCHLRDARLLPHDCNRPSRSRLLRATNMRSAHPLLDRLNPSHGSRDLGATLHGVCFFAIKILAMRILAMKV